MSDASLYIDDDDRYARLRLIGWWEQSKLTRARVLVVGAGALGSEVLKNLALVGVGTIYVVDFDSIERSNLARAVLYRPQDCGRLKTDVAVETLRLMNSELAFHSLPINIMDVGLGLFRDMDVVIGCLDNREARLWVNRACWKVGTPWVDGGIQEINGVVKVFVPPTTACYECAMTENDYRLINLRYSCPLLGRDDILSGKVPTAPTIASIIAGLQVQEALKLLHGLETLRGEALVFNGVANQFYRTRFQFRDDCLSHETYDDILELPLSHRHTAAELLAAVKPHVGSQPVLQLDRDLVVDLVCAACDYEQRVLQPVHAVGLRRATCPHCGQMAKPTIVHQVTEDSPLADQPLATLGVPAYDVLRVVGGQGQSTVLLAADRPPSDSGAMP